ncbi:hypothetical protein TCAL_17020 [Tigriopus californicus]|uniref:Uncharacterized protein n=1 Tax=Tigriopus californicus TaxID=6832 RepID=A0A553PFU2_TIGCA|nr:hypothetical protein TCAL_17020 [Tigriopus californicus]
MGYDLTWDVSRVMRVGWDWMGRGFSGAAIPPVKLGRGFDKFKGASTLTSLIEFSLNLGGCDTDVRLPVHI